MGKRLQHATSGESLLWAAFNTVNIGGLEMCLVCRHCNNTVNINRSKLISRQKGKIQVM